jgi:hypothetical protein
MVPEDLLFWISPINEAPTVDPSVLCRRHADAMVVPRGWTLDDRREPTPRLFSTRSLASASPPERGPRRRRAHVADGPLPVQMQIDGTGEIARPEVPNAPGPNAATDQAPDDGADRDTPKPWQPDFDVDDDLDGLLQVSSPLLARAFRGTDRPKR